MNNNNNQNMTMECGICYEQKPNIQNLLCCRQKICIECVGRHRTSRRDATCPYCRADLPVPPPVAPPRSPRSRNRRIRYRRYTCDYCGSIHDNNIDLYDHIRSDHREHYGVRRGARRPVAPVPHPVAPQVELDRLAPRIVIAPRVDDDMDLRDVAIRQIERNNRQIERNNRQIEHYNRQIERINRQIERNKRIQYCLVMIMFFCVMKILQSYR
jgi:hypothetical protein